MASTPLSHNFTCILFTPFLLLLGIFSGTTLAAEYFVDPALGNDGWSGTVPEPFPPGCTPTECSDGPWQSVLHVFSYGRTSGFSGGVHILFKRGEEFYVGNPGLGASEGGPQNSYAGNFGSSGEPGNHIVLDAYGEGPKPLFRVRVRRTSEADWSPSPTQTGNWEMQVRWGAQDMWENDIALRKASSSELNDGNWYNDGTLDSILYYRPRTGILATNTVHYGRSGNLDFTDRSYITIRNLQFRTSLLPIRAKAEQDEVHDLTVEYCDFHSAHTGIDMWARYQHIRRIKVLHNTFQYGLRSVSFVTNNTTNNFYDSEIAYNTIEDVNSFNSWGGDQENMYMQNIQNTHIHHNRIVGGAVNGISMWENDGSIGNIIEYNYIADLLGPAGGQIGTAIAAFTQPFELDLTHSNKIRHNIIVNCDRGIRINSGVNIMPGNEVTNNTIAYCGVSLNPNFMTHGLIIRNNISLNPLSKANMQDARHVVRDRDPTLITMNNNLYYPNQAGLWEYAWNGSYDFDTWRAITGLDSASPLPADPLFVSTTPSTAEEFMLSAASPAIDQGFDTGVSRDFSGAQIIGTPDLGAYEYQDPDQDGLNHSDDNCPLINNSDQADLDNDGLGDACDTDKDGDGVDNAADCNPDDPSIYPGAPEIIRDGIDQDCNGFDLTIVIEKAEYDAENKKLKVEAESLLNGTANLSLDNFGAMEWKREKGRWRIKAEDLATNPVTVTVSGQEGSVSTVVKLK